MPRVTLVPFDHPAAGGTGRMTLTRFAEELAARSLPLWKPLPPAWGRLFRAAAARVGSSDPAGVAEKARQNVSRLGPDDCLREAAAYWADGGRGPFADSEFVAEGFADPTPLEAALLDTLGAERVGAAPVNQPAGLSHLARELFSDGPTRSPATTGLHRIDGPGPVGELTLVARRIRSHLAAGVPATQIVVTARRLTPVLRELREVFAEYAVPVTLPEPDPLAADPAVKFLLRAWRVPETEFAFPAVGAVLRNSLFAPPGAAPDLPLKAELFLRLTNEPGGRETYLDALTTWGTVPPKPLEDEHPADRRRKQLLTLAGDVGSFLPWFFARWDGSAAPRPPAAWAKSLRAFARDFGLNVGPFLGEVDAWAAMWPKVSKSKTVAPDDFTATLDTLAAFSPGPLPVPGGVRVLPPEAARTAACEILFVVNLGEGSFPDLAGDPTDERLAAERTLFRDLVGRPAQELCLSYPAVDTKGQTLLPSSFLTAVEACFEPGAIPTDRRRMRIEGYAADAVFSAAEARTAFARDVSAAVTVPDAVRDNLIAARAAAAKRYGTDDFTEFDGKLSNPAALADVLSRVGPETTFSPTGLETFVACPFRYWFDRVLRLQPLEDPAAGIEPTRRGEAVHRAMKRLYQDEGGAIPKLAGLVNAAALELAGGAASPAGKALWELEGRYLARLAAKFQSQEDKYRKHFAGAKPEHLERDIPAVTLDADGEVLIVGGRIDRIDVVDLDGETGFTVVDYKTGAATGYGAKAVLGFERIQLGVYALAAEAGLVRGGRPVGFVYWGTAKAGPLSIPRKEIVEAWRDGPAAWAAYRANLLKLLGDVLRLARAGTFALSPRAADCTAGCRFGPACRIGGGRGRHKAGVLPLPTGAPADTIGEE